MSHAVGTAGALLAQLRQIVGESHVISDPSGMAGWLIDVRRSYEGEALAVVEPGSSAEVAQVVRLCAAHDQPITPLGGNTGLTGAAAIRGRTAGQLGLGLSLRRMNRIREISALDGTITLEAGCILQHVQEAAAAEGLYFPLSLGAEGSCQIGGVISTNAGGTAALRYGVTRQLVMGLEVVLPDGQILSDLCRLRKDNTGYDLRNLFIGAEGTLGIVTAAVMKVMPAPQVRATAMVALTSVRNALELLRRLHISFGDRVSSAEITERDYMALVLEQLPQCRAPFEVVPAWSLLLEIADTTPHSDLNTPLETLLAAAFEDGLIQDATIAQNQAQADAFWALRHGVSEALRQAGPNMSHDSSVPLEAQEDYVARTRDRIAAKYPKARCLYVGHMGDGNMHLVVLFPKSFFPDQQAFAEVASGLDKVIDAVVAELSGSITAEHGIGISYRSRMQASLDPVKLSLMLQLKTLLDPQKIMNPGKLFL